MIANETGTMLGTWSGGSTGDSPVPAGDSPVSVYRSADFQSSVSPISNRQSLGSSQDLGSRVRSAIQQTTSLRYERRRHVKQILSPDGTSGDSSRWGRFFRGLACTDPVSGSPAPRIFRT